MTKRQRGNIALILVTYNQKDVTMKTLALLQEQTVVPDIIVVDNFSDDGTKEIIERQFPLVTVLRTKGNYGGSGGYCIGTRYAYKEGYEWIIMSDNDAFPISKNLIEELVDSASENVVTQPWNVDEDTKGGYHFWFFHYVCVHRLIYCKVGFPKFDFFIYGDEVEFSNRLKKNNILIKKNTKVNYSHPIKRSRNANLHYFKVRNQLYITGEYYSFFNKILYTLILSNALFIYGKIGEYGYCKFGFFGFRDFLFNYMNNENIKKKIERHNIEYKLNLDTFISKFGGNISKIGYKSNGILQFNQNLSNNRKEIFYSVKKNINSEYFIIDSVLDFENVLLSFFSKKIISINLINLEKKEVIYSKYNTGTLIGKILYISIANIILLPFLFVIILKLVFFGKLQRERNMDLSLFIE